MYKNAWINSKIEKLLKKQTDSQNIEQIQQEISTSAEFIIFVLKLRNMQMMYAKTASAKSIKIQCR